MEQVTPESVGFSSEKLTNIETMCNRYINKGQIAGVSAIIVKNDKVVYRNNIGYSNIKNRTPIQDDTIYKIYSMTKVITVAAALILFDEGHFSLDDPIKDYIPAFKDPKIIVDYTDGKLTTKRSETDITIKHLLTMTSGISYGWEEEGLDKYYNDQFKIKQEEGPKPTLESFVNDIASFPLKFEPGSDYLYSYSIDVIGRLIEVISGKKYSKFVKERLLDPLGMKDTVLSLSKDKRERLATMYEWKDRKLSDIKDERIPFEMPGGGYYSTLDDQITFCQFLKNTGNHNGKQILGRKTIELMSRNHLTGNAFDTMYKEFKKGYGYGLGVRNMMNTSMAGLNGSTGEWGWDGMASTWMCIDPKEDLTAVFMIQLVPYNCIPVQTKFQQIMYGALRD